jgi:hypothetical protein
MSRKPQSIDPSSKASLDDVLRFMPEAAKLSRLVKGGSEKKKRPTLLRADASPQSSLAPDDVLRKVADLGRVSANQHDFYFSGVRYYIREACKLSGLVKGGLEKEKGTALLRAARALYEVLGILDTDEREFLQRILGDESEFNVFYRISGRRLGELKSVTYQLVLLFSLVTGTPHPVYPYEGPRPRQRGKTPGALKDPIFQNFVCAFLILTRRSLGGFTLEKNIRTGTLIKAIKILTPFLPDGLVPKRLSTSTLQRLKTWCEHINIDPDDVDYGLDDLWMYSLYPRHPARPPETRTGPELVARNTHRTRIRRISGVSLFLPKV